MATKGQKAAPKKAKAKYPEKFTANAIINYIAENNDISKKEAKEIIEDVWDVINAGVLKGQRVNVGNFGKIFVRVKPATKARMGRNPLTGEEIQIAAKKATKVPKFSFAKSFKEAAKTAKVQPKKK